MLSIGAALLGSSHVLGLDVDPDALEMAQSNCEQFEDELPVSFIPLQPVLIEVSRVGRSWI
jgi:predicted RNA methylase